MHKLLFSCFILFAPILAFAQSPKVTGSVTGSGKPVFAATVALIDVTDSTKIKAAVTDSAGRFIIQLPQPGNYRLYITCIGYQRYAGKSISITANDLDLGQITLIPAQKSTK